MLETSLASRISTIVREMQDGMTPDVLVDWYVILQRKIDDLCPDDLRGRITVEQDKILPMKFKLNISRRLVPFVLMAIQQTLPEMPLSTRLYFEKVREIILEESAKKKMTKKRTMTTTTKKKKTNAR